jgi:ribosomal protein S18 acetylase RimI-like enzyme
MTPEDVPAAVELQKSAFPPPFSDDLHWDPEHLEHHIAVFPEGQFVAERTGQIVGSCSNAIIPEDKWQAHASWGKTVGGPYIRFHTDKGTTLYGLDITVAPASRRMGIGGAFYHRRFDIVRERKLMRYGAGCRIPDYRTFAEAHPGTSPAEYAQLVVDGRTFDRTLSPLLSYGLRFLGIIENYMPDIESGDAGALLEWTP